MPSQEGSETDSLVESAVLGKRIEMFFDTDVGKFIMERADEDVAALTQKLKTISPWRRHRIGQLQARIHMLESFQLWVAAAIVDGIRATEVLEDN